MRPWRLAWSAGPPRRTRYRCDIDAAGCVRCGSREFEQRRIIDHQLAATWELSERERGWMDEREGHFCRGCGLSKRVRMLLWALRRSEADLGRLSVLHVNRINGLGECLGGAGRLVQTLYAPHLDFGRDVDGFSNQDLTRMTFADDSFDLVLHSETLEHVPSWQRALHEVERVLRPRGRQIYTVPLLHGRRTRQRAALDAHGAWIDLCPPSFHGLAGEDLVVWEFGGDLLRHRRHRVERIYYDSLWRNPTVFAVVERLPAA